MRIATPLIAALGWSLASCAFQNDAVNAPNRTPEELQADREISNAFASDERSSHNVDATLASCLKDVADYSGRGLSDPNTQTWFCVCMTDAMGVSRSMNIGMEPAARQCIEFARHTTAGFASDERTPFTGASALTSRQISNAQRSCLDRAGQDPHSAMFVATQKIAYCSCLTDSMRARRTADTESPSEVVSSCADRAAGARW